MSPSKHNLTLTSIQHHLSMVEGIGLSYMLDNLKKAKIVLLPAMSILIHKTNKIILHFII